MLLRALELIFAGGEKGDVVQSVPLARLRFQAFALVAKFFSCQLPGQLVEGVAILLVSRMDVDERLVNQRFEQRAPVVCAVYDVARYLRCGAGGETAPEDGERSEHALRIWREQAPGALEDRVQALMAGRHIAKWGGQPAQVALDTRGDLIECESVGERRRQLDPQRHSRYQLADALDVGARVRRFILPTHLARAGAE